MSHQYCDDCTDLAVWELESVRDAVVVPADSTSMFACEAHRLDATEHMINQYGNVTITECLG